MAKSRKSAEKVIHVIARFEFRRDPRKVAYTCLSSDGTKQYTTCLYAGIACSCDCPSRKRCRHMTQVEAKEQERAEAARALVFGALKEVYDIRSGQWTTTSEHRQSAPLQRQGFSLMR